ncbi:hypothetical protein B0H17DRAFT_866466, partial [Mycena rosella]
RKLSDIILGCLTTIFACTWVSVHPNVPAPGQSAVRLALRRFMIMMVGVIAPEVVVFFAARQFLVSRKFAETFGVSMTHGFFFSMGGFVAYLFGHPPLPPSEIDDQIHNKTGAAYLSDMRAVSAEEIMDRSKGDGLSKGVALLQGLWFITQSLTRQIQHLPITELEVATLAFATLNIFTWLLWWNKPLDVHLPIVIGPDMAAVENGPPE